MKIDRKEFKELVIQELKLHYTKTLETAAKREGKRRSGLCGDVPDFR